MTDQNVPPSEPIEPTEPTEATEATESGQPAAPARPAARAAAPAAPARPARPAVPAETAAEDVDHEAHVEAPAESAVEAPEETPAEAPAEPVVEAAAPIAAETPAAPVAPEPAPEPAPAPAAATPPPPPPAAPYAPVAVEESKPNRFAGIAKRLAIPAVIVVGLLAFNQFKPEADRNDDGQITDKGSVASTEVRKGDCVKLPDAAKSEEGGEVESMTAIPCAQPHDAEAIAATNMKNPAFPGDAKIEAFAGRFCDRQYRAFVGKPYRNENAIQLSYLYPTKGSWAQGDRGVTCIVYQDGKQTTGTLKGRKL